MLFRVERARLEEMMQVEVVYYCAFLNIIIARFTSNKLFLFCISL